MCRYLIKFGQFVGMSKKYYCRSVMCRYLVQKVKGTSLSSLLSLSLLSGLIFNTKLKKLNYSIFQFILEFN